MRKFIVAPDVLRNPDFMQTFLLSSKITILKRAFLKESPQIMLSRVGSQDGEIQIENCPPDDEAGYPYEYQVNTSDIEGMMKMSLHPPIYKTSYEIPYRSILKNVVGRGYTDEGWVDDASIQISMYHGVLSPLVIADLYGFPDQKNALPMPSWLLNWQEVTGQSEYSEFALSKAQRIPFLA